MFVAKNVNKHVCYFMICMYRIWNSCLLVFSVGNRCQLVCLTSMSVIFPISLISSQYHKVSLDNSTLNLVLNYYFFLLGSNKLVSTYLHGYSDRTAHSLNCVLYSHVSTLLLLVISNKYVQYTHNYFIWKGFTFNLL